MFSFFRILSRNKIDSIHSDIVLERLLEADVEYDIAETLIQKEGNIKKEDFKNKLLKFLDTPYPNKDANIFASSSLTPFSSLISLNSPLLKPLIYLIIGVNGAGKTTTIARLGKLFKDSNKKVIFGAGDTFRAAAIEQISIWGERLNIPCIKSKHGADSASVAFDTINAAISRDYDIALIDTAGRLDNKINLKNELIKISNTCKKATNGGPFYNLLVLDGTQGSHALNQAKIFNEALGIDGIIITKLDGTSKGGSIISIIKNLKLPILYVGIGEGENDLIPFNLDWYIQNLLDYIFCNEEAN